MFGYHPTESTVQTRHALSLPIRLTRYPALRPVIRPQYLKNKIECRITGEANRTNLGQYPAVAYLLRYLHHFRTRYTNNCRI